jgi:pimeloyl-ACP methyl ester carboxylesterase
MIKIMIAAVFLAAASSYSAEPPKGHTLTPECQSFIEQIKGKYDYDWISTKAIPSSLSLVEAANPDVFIFYYYKRTDTPNVQLKNPIVFFNGGPGYVGHGQNDQLDLARMKFQIKTELNFVFIDQRGTGCSSPYPIGTSRETLETLKWFGSHGIVSDSELVRKKLIGDRKWKIFGQSYGAHIVYRYLSQYPESVSKAYAHGNAIGISDEDRTYYRILSQYTVMESYLKVYPQDRKRLFALRLYLSDKNICLDKDSTNLCGYEIMTPLIYALGYKNSWANLNSWLRVLVPVTSVSDEGLKSYVLRFISKNLIFNYHNILKTADIEKRMSVALNFIGLYDWNTLPLTKSVCQKTYDRIKKNLKVSDDIILLDECQAPMQFEYEDQIQPVMMAQMPDFKPDYVAPKQVLDNVVKNKISLFTYSGNLDCYVPKQDFAFQNKIFGTKVKYTNFVDSGHDGYLIERQVFVDLTR